MLMKKLVLFSIIGILILVGFIMPVSAQEKINVMVDNSVLVFEDQDPMTIDGRTMVPMRKIFETLGADIEWDGTTNTVTALKEGIKIDLKIGSDTAKKNGVDVKLDVPAQALNGRTMVPLRFVSEAMGSDVSWDGSTKTVEISTGKTNGQTVQEQNNISQDGDKVTIDQGRTPSSPEQMKAIILDNIQSLINNGTITQEQAEKIADAFFVGSGMRISPNSLDSLVEQGAITRAQADAVMNFLMSNSQGSQGMNTKSN